ncbi:hypothetical protein ANCCAN_21355 [Ancylostoma caninum]|uniref:Uncharacterized protein n=1 Tax=Ancylostoma caninum TaxID=29170 RepID=A0A368FLA5_ANCCA|nr:hypothetical protein ANCCAN_21355 [Ancylostoma caninum]
MVMVRLIEVSSSEMSDELRDDECIAALKGLLVLLGEGRRCYVDESNVPHLDTRFRIFDSYLASLSSRKFHELTRLYPQEFEVVHSRLATNLEHHETHRSPVTTRHRYVGHTESFVQMGGEFALGTSTACNFCMMRLSHYLCAAPGEKRRPIQNEVGLPSGGRSSRRETGGNSSELLLFT